MPCLLIYIITTWSKLLDVRSTEQNDPYTLSLQNLVIEYHLLSRIFPQSSYVCTSNEVRD